MIQCSVDILELVDLQVPTTSRRTWLIAATRCLYIDKNEHVHIGVERVNEPERFSLTMEASNAHPRLHARSRSFVGRWLPTFSTYISQEKWMMNVI